MVKFHGAQGCGELNGRKCKRFIEDMVGQSYTDFVEQIDTNGQMAKEKTLQTNQ